MKDLKNLIPDEETARELLNHNIAYYPTGGVDISRTIKNFKQSGIIRKSALEEAREKTDSYINKHAAFSWNSDELNQLIQVEREAADNKE
jgi:hypothetical protein